jgi:hypothetical protein
MLTRPLQGRRAGCKLDQLHVGCAGHVECLEWQLHLLQRSTLLSAGMPPLGQADERYGGYILQFRLPRCALATILLADALGAPALAFEVRPNPNMTSASVRIDGHDVNTPAGTQRRIAARWVVPVAMKS